MNPAETSFLWQNEIRSEKSVESKTVARQSGDHQIGVERRETGQEGLSEA
jgi:hypothetical protein